MATKVTFHIPAEVDMQFLSDVIDIAAYQSINYWADIRGWQEVHEAEKTPASNWLDISLNQHDEDEEKGHRITVVEIAKGIERIFSAEARGKAPYLNIAAYIVKYIIDAVRDNDAGEIDSEAADVIVQAALFDEIVYG